MKIYFERSGGFSGSRIAATIDTNLLRSGERKQISDLLYSSKFFDLASKSQPLKVEGVDFFKYKITVDTEGHKQFSLEITDFSTPPELKPLINFMTERAQKV